MKTEAMVQTGVYVQETMKSPAYQAYQILRWGFVAAPILAGLDKFFMKLTDWTMYLVAFKPKIGGYVVAFWLWGIIVNLLLLQNYYDVALRDFGLSLGALALARLAGQFEH